LNIATNYLHNQHIMNSSDSRASTPSLLFPYEENIPIVIYDQIMQDVTCLPYDHFTKLVVEYHTAVMNAVGLPNTEELNRQMVQVTSDKWNEVTTSLAEARRDVDEQLMWWACSQISEDTRITIESRLEEYYQGRIVENKSLLRDHIIQQEKMLINFRNLLHVNQELPPPTHDLVTFDEDFILAPLQMPTFPQQELLAIETPKKKKVSKTNRVGYRALPYTARCVLFNFYKNNITFPYPTGTQKKDLMAKTGLDSKQINTWFTNRRCRKWRKDLEQIQASGSIEDDDDDVEDAQSNGVVAEEYFKSTE
jgi:hypothetical protein